MLRKHRFIFKNKSFKAAQNNFPPDQPELPLFGLVPSLKYKDAFVSSGPNPVYDMYFLIPNRHAADPLFWMLSRSYNLPNLNQRESFMALYYALPSGIAASRSLDMPDTPAGVTKAKVPQIQIGQTPVTHYLWWFFDPTFMGIHSALRYGEEMLELPEHIKNSYLARFMIDTASLSTTMMASHYSWSALDHILSKSPISNAYKFYRNLGGIATPLLLIYDLAIHTPKVSREHVLEMAKLNSPRKVFEFNQFNPLPRFYLSYLSDWNNVKAASFVLGKDLTATQANINELNVFRRHNEQLAKMLSGIYGLHRISIDLSSAPQQYQEFAIATAAQLDSLLSSELAWRLGLSREATESLLMLRKEVFPVNPDPKSMKVYWQKVSGHLNAIASDLTLVSAINYASNLGELLFGNGPTKDALSQFYYENLLLRHNSRLFSLPKMMAETLTATGVSTPVGTAYLVLSRPMWKYGFNMDMSMIPDLLQYYNESIRLGVPNKIFSRNFVTNFGAAYYDAFLSYHPRFYGKEIGVKVMKEIFGNEAGLSLIPNYEQKDLQGMNVNAILERIESNQGLTEKEIELLEKAALAIVVNDIFKITTPMSATVSHHVLRRAVYSKAISSSDLFWVTPSSYGSGKTIMDLAFKAMEQELLNNQQFGNTKEVIDKVNKVLARGEGVDENSKKLILAVIHPETVSRQYIQLITVDLLFADKDKLVKFGFHPQDAEKVAAVLSNYRKLALRNPEYLSFALEAVGDILRSKDQNGWSLLERLLYFHYRSLYYELGKRIESDPNFLSQLLDSKVDNSSRAKAIATIAKLNQNLVYQYFMQPLNHLSMHREEFFKRFGDTFLSFIPPKFEIANHSEQEIYPLKTNPVANYNYYGYTRLAFATALHDCIERLVPSTPVKKGNAILNFRALNYFDYLSDGRDFYKSGAVPAWLIYFLGEAGKTIVISAAMLLASYGISTVVQSHTESQLRNKGIDHYRGIEPIFQLHPQYNMFTPELKKTIFDCVFNSLVNRKADKIKVHS